MGRRWAGLVPPHGCEVRRLVGWLLIAFGVIRLLRLPAAGEVSFAWLMDVPFWVAPGIKALVGAGLLASNGPWRLRWPGLAMTALACAYCAVLARASWPSWNGMMIYALFVVVLLAEAGSRHECH